METWGQSEALVAGTRVAKVEAEMKRGEEGKDDYMRKKVFLLL